MRRALVLLAVLLFAGAAFAQPAPLAPCLVAGTDCGGSGSGTVTTTGTLASGQVALGSGATSITGDAGLTYDASTDTLTVAGACVVPTLSPAADVLSQRRGTNAQKFRIYKTDDGAGNAEWLTIDGSGGGTWGATYFEIRPGASGTGTARNVTIGSTGNIIVQADASLYLIAARITGLSLPTYANNAAAVTGGLTAGTMYKTGGDPDVIAVVH